MKHYKIKLTDKFSGVRLVTVTAKTAGEAMDLVDAQRASISPLSRSLSSIVQPRYPIELSRR